MRKKAIKPHNVLGAALRSRRRFLGLSQAELGKHAGCGLTFVNQLERGKSSVRLSKLFDVLNVLGLTLQLQPGGELMSISEKLSEKK